MTTKRKPVKKAAKKVVKKPTANEVVIRSLSSGVNHIQNKLNETRIDVSELRDEVLSCKERIGDVAMDLKKTDDYYHNLFENNAAERIIQLEKTLNLLSWAWGALALTITAFVAYAIITA